MEDPFAQSARVRTQLVAEVHLRSRGVDVVALHEEALVEVADHALAAQPRDGREDARRHERANLHVEATAYQGRRQQWRVQDQPVHRARASLQHRHRHRGAEAEPAEVVALHAGVRAHRLDRACERPRGVASGQRSRRAAAGQVGDDQGTDAREVVEPRLEVLGRPEEAVAENQGGTLAPHQVPDPAALVCGEPFLELRHREPTGRRCRSGRAAGARCSRCRSTSTR